MHPARPARGSPEWKPPGRRCARGTGSGDRLYPCRLICLNPVPDATDGFDDLGAGSELLAQAEDMGVDRAIDDLHPLALDQIDQLVTREHFAAMDHQG